MTSATLKATTAPASPEFKMADYFSSITVGVGLQLPEAPAATARAEDRLEALQSQTVDSIQAMKETLPALFKPGKPNRQQVEKKDEFEKKVQERAEIEQKLEQSAQSVSELLVENKSKLLDISGITKTEDCVSRLESLEKIERTFSEISAGISKVLHFKNEMIGEAVENNLATGKTAGEYGKSVTNAASKVTEYVEAVREVFNQTREELKSIESRISQQEAPSASVKFIDHRPGYFSAVVSGEDLSNYSFEQKGTQQQPATQAAAEKSVAADCAAEVVAPAAKTEAPGDDVAEGAVVASPEKKDEQPVVTAASASPIVTPEVAAVVENAPQNVEAAPVAKVAPEQVEKFKEAVDEIKAGNEQKYAAQAEHLKELREDIAAIKARLKELEQPAAKPAFWSMTFRPLVWVQEYFEKRDLTKALAKQETLLNEARHARVETRQERIDQVRDRFGGRPITIPRTNPDGVPPLIRQASIPASKVGSLISFKTLSAEIVKAAPSGSVTLKPKEGTIEIELDDKKLLFRMHSDGKVTAFADLDGNSMKRVARFWNDDALKLANKFLKEGKVSHRARPYDEDRVIPDSGFLANK